MVKVTPKQKILLGVALLLIALGAGIAYYSYQVDADTAQRMSRTEQAQTEFTRVLAHYAVLIQKIAQAKARGIDTTTIDAQVKTARDQLIAHDYTQAEQTIIAALAALDELIAQKDAAAAKAKQEAEEAAKRLAAATPMPAPKPKPAATAPPQTTTSSVTGSSYERKTVNTSRGSYSVDVITMDLAKVRMITDAAADNDCSDNCPTKSLQSYVSSNGGFAGINGTYFCPADYAACAGKINTFYWKVFVTRLNKIINANNGMGESDPAIVMTTGGEARYFSHWSDFAASGISISAGINSRPALVQGGQVILNESELDDKQRTTKGNRGALGVKGNTVYGIIAHSATVIDLAAVAQALGVDSAMNLDGGGSSAMYYNGSYKVGPGRSLPNAIIFAAR